MATSLNVNTLPEYIDQKRDELFVKSVLGTRTIDYLDIMSDVKYKSAIHYLDSEVALHKATCGWNPDGSDTFTERYIEVTPLEVQKEWCWLDFEKTYANYQLNYAAGRERLPFEEKIANTNVEAIQAAVDTMIWQGDTGLSINGILAEAEAESAATIAVEFESGQTVSDKIAAMVAAIPMSALKKGVTVFMSETDFRNYAVEQNGICCSNKPVLDAAANSFNYFGDSRIKLVPVSGLEGTGAMAAFPADAVIYATDIEGAESEYRMWYEKKDKKFLFQVLFNFGIGFRWPDEVVVGKEDE